jgi:hypothetical protein
MRDMSFIEELLKCKTIMGLMQTKIDGGSSDVDIVEYSIATKMLESKIQILKALDFQVEENKEKIVLNIKGSGKAIEIDIAKLKEAITIIDNQVEEK